MAIVNYVECLTNKNFDGALYYGRIHYSLERHGIGGISGNNLSVDDEQRIANDINAMK